MDNFATQTPTANPQPGLEKPNGNGKGNGNVPPPVRSLHDEAGIEALARYFGKWPLQGVAGQSWGSAMTYVNGLREEHFKGKV